MDPDLNRKPLRTTTPKIAEDVVIHDPEVFDIPDYVNEEPTLSEAETTFFKQNGILAGRICTVLDHVNK
jgi:hypothetical protein